MSRGVEVTLLITVMILTGIASWWLMFRASTDHDPGRIDLLPRNLNGWESVDIEVDASVSEMLGADHNVQRAYRHPHGYQAFVYVGYYGTRSGGTPEHTPDICYPAQGWAILDSARRHVGGRDGFDLRELIVEKNGERRIVHFWYRTGDRSGMTSVTELRFNLFWNRITQDRGDGALIRLSIPVTFGDVEAARVQLYGMDSAVDPAVAEFWPGRS